MAAKESVLVTDDAADVKDRTIIRSLRASRRALPGTLRRSLATAEQVAEAPPAMLRSPELAPELVPASELMSTGLARTSSRDTRQRWALVASDVLALMLTYAVLRLAVAPHDTPRSAGLIAALPLWLLINKTLGLYDRSVNLLHKSTLNEWPTIAQSILLSVALMFIVFPSVAVDAVHNGWLIMFTALGCALTAGFRATARATVRHSTSRERVLVVGSGVVASLVARKLLTHTEYGTVIKGYIDVEDPADATRANAASDSLARLGGVGDFQAACRQHDVERVVVAFSSLQHEALLDIVRIATSLNLKISIVPRLFEVVGPGVELDQLEGMTLLTLGGRRRTRGALVLKRGTDILGASLLLLVAAPVMLITALVIKATSAGPVLFVQERTGRANRRFKIFKFRTMVDGADSMKADVSHLNECADLRMFKITDDPRFTPPGHFLRRMSIDELPQLFNVLRGDMSLVGPRPLVPEETDHILGWHRARLDLMPGLTGPWQVMGRHAIPFDEMVKLDYLYVADWSLWNDFKLLLRTFPVVVRGRGT